MVPENPIHSFLQPLKALQTIFASNEHHGVIIGGIAVSLLGEARLTADIDALVLLSPANILNFLQDAEKVGIFPRIKDAEDFARTNRVLLMVHSATQTKIDIILGMLPFEEEVLRRSKQITIDDLFINLPTVEDLIIMKTVAQRPKDNLDIQGLVKTNKNLDMKRIEEWVRIFGDSLDIPDLWKKTNSLIKKARQASM